MASHSPPLRRSSSLLIALLAIVLGFGALLYSTSTLNRPLGADEARSMNSHTSFGYFRTRADLAAKPLFSVSSTAKGFLRSIINWKSWDAHIGDCWAISTSTFFFGFSEMSARLPSLLAALGAAACLMLWGYRQTRSPALVLLLGLCFLVTPGIHYYAQTARGYTIALFLMFLNLLICERNWNRMNNFWIVGALALLNYLQILNLLSMLFMWVVPLALCGMVWYLFVFNREPQGQGRGWRASLENPCLHGWIFQCGIALLLFGQFVLDHFAILVYNLNNYGLPVHSLGDLIAQTGAILAFLLPGPWQIVGLLGAAGWLVMTFSKSRHWLGPTALLSVAITLVFGLVAHKLPYPRNCLVYSPLFLMGVAGLWKWGQTLGGQAARFVRPSLGVVLAFVAVYSFQKQLALNFEDSFAVQGGLSLTGTFACKKLKAEGKSGNEVQIFMPFYNDVDDQFIRLYYPDDRRFFVPSPDKPADLDVYLPCLACPEGFGFNCKSTDASREYNYHFFPKSWARYIACRNAGAALYVVPMRWRADLPEDFGNNACAIAAWVAPKKTDIPLADYLEREVAAHKEKTPVDYAVKTLSGQPCAFFFLSNADDLDYVRGVIKKLDTRAKGATFFFEERSR